MRQQISDQKLLTALWECRGNLPRACKALSLRVAQVRKREEMSADLRHYIEYISRVFDPSVQDKMIKAFAETRSEMAVCHSVSLPPDVVMRIREYDPLFERRWADVASGRYDMREQVKITLAESRLSSRHLDCLEALRELRAISQDTRRQGEAVALKIFGHDSDANAVKVPLADLKRLGLVDSKGGKGGGSWATEAGLRALQHERPKR